MAQVDFIEETEDMRLNGLTELKRRLQGATECQESFQLAAERDDWDAFLLRFLRSKRYDMDGAEEKLLEFAKWSGEHGLTKPDLCCVDLTDRTKLALETGLYQFPGPDIRDCQGRQILFVFPGRHEPWNFTPEESLTAFYYLMDKILSFEHVQLGGITVIGYNPEGEMRRFDMKLMPLMARSIQGKFPMRVGRLVMFKPPGIMSVLLPLMKKVMNAVLIQRILIIKENEGLKGVFPAASTPTYAGGSFEIEFEFWLGVMLDPKRVSALVRTQARRNLRGNAAEQGGDGSPPAPAGAAAGGEGGPGG